MAINKTMNIRERQKSAPSRPGQLSVRKQRIENWAYKDRNLPNANKSIRSLTSLKTTLIQKQSESSVIQADRRLNMNLYQLGQQRERLSEQHNFDQKLFANKQALRHKDNENIQRTLDYVRKCCKYSDMDENINEYIDPTISFEENRSKKPNRSRPVTAITQKLKKQNLSDDIRREKNVEKFLRYDDNQKRQVQFRTHSIKRGSQSAYVSHRLTNESRAKSIHEIRTINSAPSRTTIYDRKESIKPKRTPSRMYSRKNILQEFRRYPERFLSSSNCYLPLLRRQAIQIGLKELQSKKKPVQPISHFSDSSEFTFDDAKSFLSDDNDIGKPFTHSHPPVWDSHNRQNIIRGRTPSKINLMETFTDNSSGYALTLSHLRNREYEHLQKLIDSNPIKHILEPFSPMKTLESKHKKPTTKN